MKLSLKRLSVAAVTATALAGTLTSTALATSSAQILNDVALATAQAGEEQATTPLAVRHTAEKISTRSSTGIDISVPKGTVTHTHLGTIVKGPGASNIIFQAVSEEAHRTSVHIANQNDPERYEFTIAGVERLQKQLDGSVLAFDNDGQIAAKIRTPWAKDANGKDVPTYYEIHGTTLTQMVKHRSGKFVYGIVADPWTEGQSYICKRHRACCDILVKQGQEAALRWLNNHPRLVQQAVTWDYNFHHMRM